jgi:hypothetical protein
MRGLGLGDLCKADSIMGAEKGGVFALAQNQYAETKS